MRTHQLKYFVILFLCLSAFSNSYAQKKAKIKNLEKYDYKPYHFGFSLGYNEMDFAIRTNGNFNDIDSVHSITSKSKPGFNIGIVSNLRLNNHMDLRFIPTLAFGERELIYDITDSYERAEQKKSIETTNVEFPIHIKYKSVRMTNVRIFLLAGVKWSIDLASQSDKDQLGDLTLVKLKRNDFNYDVGVGYDFYLAYFKFAIQLKMSYGMRDILKQENNIYTKNLDKLNSKAFMLSFTFE